MIALFILITLLLIALFLLATVYGEKEKNVTLTITKNEFVYCTFGSSKSPTVICDSLELSNRFDMLDKFLEYLDSGIIEK